MPSTEITKTTLPGLFSTTGQAMTMAAADTTNNNYIVSGNVILIAHNTGGSSATVSITSVPDSSSGRTGDVSAQAVASGEIRIFRMLANGWADSESKIQFSASSTDVEFGFIDLNDN